MELLRSEWCRGKRTQRDQRMRWVIRLNAAVSSRLNDYRCRFQIQLTDCDVAGVCGTDGFDAFRPERKAGKFGIGRQFTRGNGDGRGGAQTIQDHQVRLAVRAGNFDSNCRVVTKLDSANRGDLRRGFAGLDHTHKRRIERGDFRLAAHHHAGDPLRRFAVNAGIDPCLADGRFRVLCQVGVFDANVAIVRDVVVLVLNLPIDAPTGLGRGVGLERAHLRVAAEVRRVGKRQAIGCNRAERRTEKLCMIGAALDAETIYDVGIAGIEDR